MINFQIGHFIKLKKNFLMIPNIQIYSTIKGKIMGTASARKRRKSPSINKASQIFSDSVINNDFDTGEKVVVSNALEILGSKGLIKALDRANAFIQRKKLR